MSINIKLLLDTRRARKDGSFPLVMRILYNRKSTNVPLGHALQPKDWNESTEKIKPSAQLSDNITRLNNYIHKRRTKAYDLMNELQESGTLESTSLSEVKKILLNRSDSTHTVFQFIDEEIESLITAQKQGSATVYKALRNKLFTQVGHENLTFAQLNFKFLKKMEERHYELGLKPGGLAVYMRTIKAIYNKAIKMGYAKKEQYPFDDYKIKQGKPVRKALSREDFEVLVNYEFEAGSVSDRVKKLFMASFYLRGANWMDMAYMRWENVKGNLDRITYIRRKTGEPFNIKVHPNLREIILGFAVKKPRPTDYLFPILTNKKSNVSEAVTIKDSRNNLNRRLKTIAGILGVEPFSIYAARHTYATTAKRKGVPTAVIQEGMGHSTESITQTYLDSFENTVVDDYDDLIMG